MARHKPEIDDLLLYQIAKMYYNDGMTQEAISKETCFSRSHISRLLDKARERHIVTFVVTNPLEKVIEELEGRLRERFHLKFVAIEGVTSDEYQGTGRRALIECIAQCAAACLPDFLSESRTTAVGLGRTLYQVSKMISCSIPLPDLEIIPAIGTTTATTAHTQSNIIVDNIASACGAKPYFTTVPIVVDRAETRSTLFLKRREELVSQWDAVDTAIVGIGGPFNSMTDPFNLNEASEANRSLVAASGIVGDILASFFYEDGSELTLVDHYTRNAMGIEQLRQVNRVLCIAGGPQKVEGIWAALHHGFVNCLVTDSMTAAEILAKEEGYGEL